MWRPCGRRRKLAGRCQGARTAGAGTSGQGAMWRPWGRRRKLAGRCQLHSSCKLQTTLQAGLHSRRDRLRVCSPTGCSRAGTCCPQVHAGHGGQLADLPADGRTQRRRARHRRQAILFAADAAGRGVAAWSARHRQLPAPSNLPTQSLDALSPLPVPCMVLYLPPQQSHLVPPTTRKHKSPPPHVLVQSPMPAAPTS
jgi:hypothetical protein